MSAEMLARVQQLIDQRRTAVEQLEAAVAQREAGWLPWPRPQEGAGPESGSR